jgi:hypothetical protein
VTLKLSAEVAAPLMNVLPKKSGRAADRSDASESDEAELFQGVS